MIGDDPLLWANEQEFAKDLKTAMDEHKELVDKRAGLGTGSQWTIMTVLFLIIVL